MKYNLANLPEAQKASDYLAQLAGRECVVEIKRVVPKRTINQNSYLHLIITAFGAHFGYDIEEAKQVYKELNASIYRYEKKGRVFWRSSAALDKTEMAKSIDRFMQASARQGYTLPPATDENWLREIENRAEEMDYFL